MIENRTSSPQRHFPKIVLIWSILKTILSQFHCYECLLPDVKNKFLEDSLYFVLLISMRILLSFLYKLTQIALFKLVMSHFRNNAQYQAKTFNSLLEECRNIFIIKLSNLAIIIYQHEKHKKQLTWIERWETAPFPEVKAPKASIRPLFWAWSEANVCIPPTCNYIKIIL